jgi:hypothetical protein
MAPFSPRPLAEAERSVLDLLLSVDYPGVAELRVQAITATVVGRCDCGCPTYDIAVDADSPPSPMEAHSLAPVELRVAALADEREGSIILFIDDGRLASVEYVSYADDPPQEWPTRDRLSTFDRG